MAALNRYIYWAEENTAALPGKLAEANVGNTVSVASPIAIVERKSVATAAPPKVVENCEQYSLSEGFDLFKAICDLAHRR